MPVLFGVAPLALFAGAMDPLLRAASPLTHGLSGSLDIDIIAAGIAPGAGLTSFHLLLFFVFAQSVHYGVWLRLVPEEDRVRPTPRSFSASYRALTSEFPPLALALVAIFAVGARGVGRRRCDACTPWVPAHGLFHGHMELALLALAWVERRRPGASVSEIR